MHLELQIIHVESRRQRYGVGRLVRLNEPRRVTVPVHLALAELPGVDTRRLFVDNRLYRLVLQAGLALMVCLVEANLVDAGYQNEVRERQQRRLDAGHRTDFEFLVVITAVTNMDVGRAIDANCDYFNWDDNRIAAVSESLRFPEYERIDPAMRQ